MLDQLWQRLDLGARLALPFVTTLLCTFLSVVKWPLPFLGHIAPPLVLITVYYWSIHRPDLFRPWEAFLIGMLNDIINYLPIGMTALIFVALSRLILTQRRFFISQSFFTFWGGFAITAFIVAMTEWLLLAIIKTQLAPLGPVIVQTILVVAIFPLPCWLLIRLQRFALSQG